MPFPRKPLSIRNLSATRWAELPSLWDVDEPADWARLQALLG